MLDEPELPLRQVSEPSSQLKDCLSVVLKFRSWPLAAMLSHCHYNNFSQAHWPIEHTIDHPDHPPLTPRPPALKIFPVALNRATGCRAPINVQDSCPRGCLCLGCAPQSRPVQWRAMVGRPSGLPVRQSSTLPVLYPCHAPAALNSTEGQVVFQPGEPP